MADAGRSALRILVIDGDEEHLSLYQEALCHLRRPGEERNHPVAHEPGVPERDADEHAPDVTPDLEPVLCRRAGEALAQVRDSAADGRPFAVAFLSDGAPEGPGGAQLAEELWRLDPAIEVVILNGRPHAPAGLGQDRPASRELLRLRKPLHPEEIRLAAGTLAAKWRAHRSLEDARAALVRSNDRYALTTRGANDGIWDWDLLSNRLFLSSRWREILGHDDGDQVSQGPDAWFSLIHPDDVKVARLDLFVYLEGLGEHFQSEHRMLHRDGTQRWVLCRGQAVRDGSGKAVRMAGSLTDITEWKRLQEDALRDAYYDALTGLASRTLFIDRLRSAIMRCRQRRGYRFSVLFVDLDLFKRVNDSLGHNVGDQLLVDVAGRCTECLRTSDTIGRLGGDEFAILLDDTHDPRDATRVAERITRSLSAPFHIDGHEVYISASIGVVLGDGSYADPKDVLRDSDIAMYRAKAKGKARYEVFDASMHLQVKGRLELETDLRRAIERRELHIHYQPIISLTTARVTGFEALVRWAHPRRGVVPPGDFIPIAEECGLIVPIEGWVLREACRQIGAWLEQCPPELPLTVAVNISGKHFAQSSFAAEIGQIMGETGVAAQSIRLEITESVLMENMAHTLKTIQELRQAGVRVQIDDFGTGYSSLSYLHELPLDTLKVDRSFVSRMCIDPSSRKIVQTIALLARALRMELVAEGVETIEQMAGLSAMHCQYAQGFLFYQPLNPVAATALVHECAQGQQSLLDGMDWDRLTGPGSERAGDLVEPGFTRSEGEPHVTH